MMTHYTTRTFTGTGTPEHAAQEAGQALAEWIDAHGWQTDNGEPAYRLTGHFERVSSYESAVWGTYYLHAFGLREERE